MAQVTKADHDAFLRAAAICKYEPHDGAVFVGSRVSDTIGFVGKAPVPAGFAHLDPNESPFIAMAILEAVQNRAGGNSKAKTAGEYQTAVSGALTSKNEESTSRVKDAVLAALCEHLTPVIRAKVPTASDADIEATAKANLAKRMAGIIANGYTPLPKNAKGTKASAAVISLDD